MPVWLHWSSQLNGCNCWDQVMQEWFLQWTPAAIAHGHAVLTTNYIDWPSGVNVMWNTSNPAIGAIAAPLTETVGVVHTMSIVLTLSLALSATTMYALLRRWTTWWAAAWIGGLVYGFSSFALDEMVPGRVNLVFDAIPPLIALALYKTIRQEWSPITGGVAIGLLSALQLFVSEELLAVTALFAGGTLVVLAVQRWEEVEARLADVARAAAAGLVTFLVLAAYPLLVQFTGPNRLSGPPQSSAQLASFSSDLFAFVLPGGAQLLHFDFSQRVVGSFSAASPGEVTEYVGLPLLAIVVTAVVLLRRQALVRIFAIVGLAALACSLGPRLIVDGHKTAVPGPDAVLVHLPVLGDIGPSRFALAMWFSVAVVVAIAAGNARVWLVRRLGERPGPDVGTLTRRQLRQQRIAVRRTAAGVVSAAAVVALLPLVPAWPVAEKPADVPAFFTSAEVDTVPSGSVAVTYPYPLSVTAWPMIWQADTNMRFHLLGGYAIGRGADGAGTFFAAPNPLEYCLNRVYSNGTAPNWLCSSWWLRESAARLGVTSVIAADNARHSRVALRVLRAAYGAAPRHIGGVWLWRCTRAPTGTGCRWD